MKKRWPVILLVFLGLGMILARIGTPPEVAGKGLPAEHALGEWYEFGYDQGKQLRTAYHMLGRPIDPSRTQLSHLITNLGGEGATVEPAAFDQCYAGLVDGMTEKAARFQRPRRQPVSILPPQLQGYLPPKESPSLKSSVEPQGIKRTGR
jgi:hypothetical protein